MPRDVETLEAIKGPGGKPLVLHKNALTQQQREVLLRLAQEPGFEGFLINFPNTMAKTRPINLPYRQHGEMKMIKVAPDGSLL